MAGQRPQLSFARARPRTGQHCCCETRHLQERSAVRIMSCFGSRRLRERRAGPPPAASGGKQAPSITRRKRSHAAHQELHKQRHQELVGSVGTVVRYNGRISRRGVWPATRRRTSARAGALVTAQLKEAFINSLDALVVREHGVAVGFIAARHGDLAVCGARVPDQGRSTRIRTSASND